MKMVRSKRKSSEESFKISKKRKEEDDGVLHDSSIFGELLTKAGFILKKGDKPNELSCDQAIFCQSLSKSIRYHNNPAELVTEFTEAFSSHLEDAKRFLAALKPTSTAQSCENSHDNNHVMMSSRSSSQESLIRLLLGVDQLQPAIISMLLEKLAEFTDDDEPVMDDNKQVNMPRLILSQLRWLNHIVNSKEVTDKMLEVICVVSLEAQREIISCIPDVVDDAEHNNVAQELRNLLMENSQLAVAILDALSNLIIKPDLLSEIRRSVISTLDSVALEDLPVIVRFLLQTVAPADAVEVVSELRQHLDFHTENPPTNSTQQTSDRRARRLSSPGSERGSEALTLDAIRSGIRFQRSIADAWIKAIEKVKSAAEHKIVDMLVVFILHSCNHKKSVESLVRNKVRAGQFTEVLLHAAFGAHTQVLREYFPSVLALVEVLLRSPEPVISYFAAAMYRHAFAVFDAYCQQEIVGSLVTHIGSGYAAEVDMALDILAELVETHTPKMAPFAIFVKGVLDYLENLSMGQIRKLYGMLSVLAFHSTQGESQIQDEMFIIIRKQLSNNDSRYKKMGVIGAIMVIQTITSDHNQRTQPSQARRQSDDEALKQAKVLLDQVQESTVHTPSAMALFLDELSSVINKDMITKKVEDWMNEKAMSDFQDDYIVDLDENTCQQETILSMNHQFGLDEADENGIVINLLPLLTKSLRKSTLTKSEKLISPMCLGPTFRLLQSCEYRRGNGDLGEIDALLGCPLLLPNTDVLSKMESLSKVEKNALCDCMFFTINWFRELLNAFANQTSAEMKGKLIMRIENITALQTQLSNCLAKNPGYTPPVALSDAEGGKMPPPPPPTSGVSKGKKGRKPKKGKKGGKGKDDDSDERNDTTCATQDHSILSVDESQQDKTDEPQGVSLEAYRPYFRELDLKVFTILQVGLITQAALDTEMNTKDVTSIQLKPQHLEFLLDDLVRKLDHSLIASATKRRTFLKTKTGQNCGFSHIDQQGPVAVITFMKKLLPALCDHLEAISPFFQALVVRNDGILDGPGFFTPEAQLMTRCFRRSLESINLIFSWTGFVSPDHRNTLKELLTTLAVRLNTAANSQMVFADLIKQSFRYVENFSNSIPDIASAVTLTRLMASLMDRAESETMPSKISELAETFLQREWTGPNGERLKGAAHNQMLQNLLRSYLGHSADVLTSLESLSTVGIQELLKEDKQGASATYPTLTRNSFPVFFRVMLTKLIETCRDMPKALPGDSSKEKEDSLLRWSMAVRIFHILVNLIKVFDAKSNLSTLLKNGRQFVEIFLRLGMPVLDETFRHQREEVQGLLKNLQLSTRSLHHVAGHSKIIRDVSLTGLVPPLKKVLEMFVYRVKAMLTLNRCLDAFWLGNLKNRDLQGEEIMTQTSADSSRDSDSESDALPDDDSDEEVEMTGPREDESDAGESYSEVF